MEGKVEAQNINTAQVAGSSDNKVQPLQNKEAGTPQAVSAPVERSNAGLFITPVIQFDSAALSVIFQVRDGLSGEIKQEYPQESVIKGREQKEVSSVPKSINVEVPEIENNAPALKPEKETQSSNGVDLNTTSAASNGSSAIASTTAGIATGLGA
jgi:hypothetical protein